MVRHRTRQSEGGHQRPPPSQSTRCGIAPAETSDAARTASPNAHRPMFWRVAMPHGEARPTTSDQSKGVGRASAAGASYQRAVRRCHKTLVRVRHSPASKCTAATQQGATETADSADRSTTPPTLPPKVRKWLYQDPDLEMSRAFPRPPGEHPPEGAGGAKDLYNASWRFPHHPIGGRPDEHPSGARKGE